MSLTKEDLNALSQLLDEKIDTKLEKHLQPIKMDLADLRQEFQAFKEEEFQPLKQDVNFLRQEFVSFRQQTQEEFQSLNSKLTALQLHVENETDKNIQLLAENHIELVKKLNQAIPTADKNLTYEVKVNYLTREVETLKQDVSLLKAKAQFA